MCKTANLLVDGYGGPTRVGVLMPLHWQLVCFVLGGVAAGSSVVVAGSADQLTGCSVAFVHSSFAADVRDVDDVLVTSGHPLGARLRDDPYPYLDAAVEVPAFGDRFGGPYATSPTVLLGGAPFVPPSLSLTASDRVLTTLDPATPDGLGVLLGALQVGASLVLATGDPDLDAIDAAERVTARYV